MVCAVLCVASVNGGVASGEGGACSCSAAMSVSNIDGYGSAQSDAGVEDMLSE